MGRPRSPAVAREVGADGVGQPVVGELRPRPHGGMGVDGRDQRGGRGAVLRALGQAASEQVAQDGGDKGQVGCLVDHPVQRGGFRPAPEGRCSAGDVHGERAQREHIGRRRRPEPQRLLGRHEGGGADPQARPGQRGGVGRPRDPEVDHPGAVRGDQHVGGLEVTVDDAHTVDALQRLGDTGHEQEDGAHRERSVPLDDLLQAGSGDVRRRQPRRTGVHAVVDHLRGEQAVDPPGAGHLLGEALAELGVGGELGPHRLQGDRTPSGGVRQVHDAHAARAQPCVEAVPADLAGVVGGQSRMGGLYTGKLSGHAVALSAGGTERRATLPASCP